MVGGNCNSIETYCSSGQVGGALTNSEIKPFNDGGVYRLRILGFQRSIIHLEFGSDDSLPFHFDDPIVATSFDYLSINTLSKTTTSSTAVEVKAVGGDEWNTLWISL